MLRIHVKSTKQVVQFEPKKLPGEGDGRKPCSNTMSNNVAVEEEDLTLIQTVAEALLDKESKMDPVGSKNAQESETA